MRSALFVRALLALAAAFVLGGTLLTVPATSAPTAPAERVSTRVSALAPGCLPSRCWTAIAFNPETLRSGWTQSSAWGSKTRAMTSAHNHCRVRTVNEGHARACIWPGKRRVFNQGGCVAVAWRLRNGRLIEWAKGKAFGPIVAQRRARAAVRGEGTIDSGYSCPPRKG
ncbi:hypothetical protein [Nocardioides antri]|uniref:DUF3011 domain-containing protein n=1 Tax=Nocardioides antri TaxID=2607659 RepID=A0A5B1M785_9ACTN|nr:hypothetical protein [Nocardioides antri]KAA1428872.1 hypothetical protein F0U47_01245 [Nocardioides antri]